MDYGTAQEGRNAFTVALPKDRCVTRRSPVRDSPYMNISLSGSFCPHRPLMPGRLCTAGLPMHLASSVIKAGVMHLHLT